MLNTFRRLLVQIAANLHKNTVQQSTSYNTKLRANTMNKELRFGREVVVDDNIEHWNVNAPCRQVCNHQHTSQLVAKLGDGYLACCRVESAVRVRARNVGFCQNLNNGTTTLCHVSNITSTLRTILLRP